MTVLDRALELYGHAINDLGINHPFVLQHKTNMGPHFQMRHMAPCAQMEHNYRTYGNAFHTELPAQGEGATAEGVEPGQQITRFKKWEPQSTGKQTATAQPPSNAVPSPGFKAWNQSAQLPTESQVETETQDLESGEVVAAAHEVGISDFDFAAIKELTSKRAIELYSVERLEAALTARGIEFAPGLNARQLINFIKSR